MASLMELPLRAIHLPEPISWWPPAFGWWLALGAVILLILAGVVILKRYLKPALRKDASKMLDQIEKTFHENEDASECLSELSKLLRRAVLSQNKSLKIAGVTGDAWLELLDQPLGQKEFSQGAGRILLNGPYLRQVDKGEVAILIQLCRKWVKTL